LLGRVERRTPESEWHPAQEARGLDDVTGGLEPSAAAWERTTARLGRHEWFTSANSGATQRPPGAPSSLQSPRSFSGPVRSVRASVATSSGGAPPSGAEDHAFTCAVRGDSPPRCAGAARLHGGPGGPDLVGGVVHKTLFALGAGTPPLFLNKR